MYISSWFFHKLILNLLLICRLDAFRALQKLYIIPTEQTLWGWLLKFPQNKTCGVVASSHRTKLVGWSLVPTEQNLWGWSLVPALTPLLINIDRLIAKLTKKEIIYIKSIYTVWLIKEYASLDHYKSCDAASFLTMKRFWVLWHHLHVKVFLTIVILAYELFVRGTNLVYWSIYRELKQVRRTTGKKQSKF